MKVKAFFVTVIVSLAFLLTACDLESFLTEPEKPAPTFLQYKFAHRGNDSFVEFDLEKHEVTIYNKFHTGRTGKKITALYEGEYPEEITAYFKETENTYTFTFLNGGEDLQKKGDDGKSERYDLIYSE